VSVNVWLKDGTELSDGGALKEMDGGTVSFTLL
jgi:hypothetical protein